MANNPFLTKLLALQQDGADAISRPSNWLQKPFLEVPTRLHDKVAELAVAVRPPASGHGAGAWHFFVGSPGNGKSACAGMLVRELIKQGDRVLDAYTNLPLEELTSSGDVPYLLAVSELDKDYPYLFIAQDASVVPHPYDPAADPASALENLLQKAERRGTSLVVCTNRGVVEKAFAHGYQDPSKNNAPWFKALRLAVGDARTETIHLGKAERKRVFDSLAVGVTVLDGESLLLGSDTFDKLIVAAVGAPDWENCNDCACKPLCPFRANRDWLADNSLRSKFIRLLTHGELLDGQTIVLREARALLSLILAGCPHDYTDGQPCNWVMQKHSEQDVFSLLGRRIYAIIFSSYAPHGIESDSIDAREQLRALKEITTQCAALSQGAKLSLMALIDSSRRNSTDVGIQRLLGSEGVFRELDPLADVLPLDFLDLWSEAWPALRAGGPWVSELEIICFSHWSDLQMALGELPNGPTNAYRWLSRWITSFTMRAGALVDGVTTFSEDLDALAGILGVSDRPTMEQLGMIKSISAILTESLRGGGEGLTLTPSATLRGEWVGSALLKPRIIHGNANGATTGMSVQLAFGSGADKVRMSTRAFVWLKRRAERAMSQGTFPDQYLETARDTVSRVAVKSNYDKQDDIEILVNRIEEQDVRMIRMYGEVYVDAA
ncbi:hypothetical protein [Cupriavidus sp. USMAA2-4]|uniref:hypothetical protein n=1 Tax=Cupriavidus sp. USMAA2-4 TaxID=876364 RepID=UPI0012F4B3BB|nr:hypothetical protein [Cupriavidus sp. USMAA2-4]